MDCQGKPGEEKLSEKFLEDARASEKNFREAPAKNASAKETARYVVHLSEAARKLETNANIDFVTGLPNVYEFFKEIKGVSEQRQAADILVVGISGFHLVNDSYGYENGNKVLREIAARARQLAAEGTLLFRLNGLKFAFLIPCRSQNKVRAVYEKFLHIIERELFIDGVPVKLYSAAASVHYHDENGDGAGLLSELDYLLEISKKEKSGELICQLECASDDYKYRLDVLGAVKRSVVTSCEGFYLVYQPQIDLAGKLIGAEALLRWRSRRFGVVPPNEFIPWLEEDICFYDLGLWILRRALSECLPMVKSRPELSISVNISYKQLQRASFCQDVLDILSEEGFPARNLILEFTEHCRSLEARRLREIVKFFKEHAIRVSADDFGTGYSALMLLRDIGFDTIKIDQGYIRGMLDSPRDRVIVDSIIGCAHKLDTKVCVEGVENKDLMELTRGFAAEYYQGYLIAKPMEFASLENFVAEYGQ